MVEVEITNKSRCVDIGYSGTMTIGLFCPVLRGGCPILRGLKMHYHYMRKEH